MHILYIHQYFTTPQQGGGTRSYEFARRLVSKGHKVSVLTGAGIVHDNKCSSVKRDSIDGIDIWHVDVAYSNNMGYKGRIKSFLKFAFNTCKTGSSIKGYDIVFATSTPLTVAIPGIFLSLYKRVPMVFEVRDLWPEVPIQIGAIKKPLLITCLQILEKFTYKYSHHVVALSPGMAEGVVNTGIKPEKVTLIPNCCDLDLFSPSKIHANGLARFSLPDRPLFVYAGAISDANGIETLISAAKVLKEKGSNAFIVFAGEGRIRAQMERLVDDLALDNVAFLGSISKFEVAELYSRATACLVTFKGLPILSTNSPNKFFDALAAGRPVITNMGGWIGDLVTENRLGFSVNQEDATALADAIDTMSGLSYDELTSIGRNARELAEKEFDRDLMAEKLESVLMNAVTKSS